jgi:hypothetical protein
MLFVLTILSLCNATMHVALGHFFHPKVHSNFANVTFGIAPYATHEYCCFAKTTTTKCLKRLLKQFTRFLNNNIATSIVC